MKLSELRPCDLCKGSLVNEKAVTWYVIRVSHAMVNTNAAQPVLGAAMILRGALKLAEVMSPRPEEAVMVLGDKQPELMTELFICQNCYLSELFIVAELVRQRNDEKRKGEEKREPSSAGVLCEADKGNQPSVDRKPELERR